MAFGGKSWPIKAEDMNIGRVGPDSPLCAGGIFEAGGEGEGIPDWIVGIVFLKNVYTVLRSQPAAIGFAELSDATGGLL